MNISIFMYKLQIALLAILAIIVMSTTVWATKYYVDPNGSDAAGDGSQGNPWKSLSHACSQVTNSGDIIHISAGNYTDNSQCILSIGVNIEGEGVDFSIITVSGLNKGGTMAYIIAQSSFANPVTDGNHNISGFTIKGAVRTTNSADWGIWVRGRDNVTISNMKFQDLYIGAIWVFAYDSWPNDQTKEPPAYGENVVIHDIETDHVTYNGNTGPGARQGAIQLVALDGAHVYNLVINENYPDAAVGVKAVPGWLKAFEGHDWTINTSTINSDAFVFEMYNFLGDSEIYDCTFNHAISLNSGPQNPIAGSTWNLKIHDTITDFSELMVGTSHELSHNYLDFYNNYIYGNRNGGGIGLWITNYLTSTSITNWRVRNNIIYDCGAGAIEITRGNLLNVQIYNNIFASISNSPFGGYGIETEGFSGTVSEAKIRNNLIMNCAAAPMYIHSNFSNTLIDHNWFYGNGNNNDIKNYGSNTMVSNNTKGIVPDINSSGNKPFPYYEPSGGNANIVDAGIIVGLPYSGASPDIGAYEYTEGNNTDPPDPPTGLKVYFIYDK